MRTLSRLWLANGVLLAGFVLASAGASAQQPYPPAAAAGAAKPAAPGTPAAGAPKAKSAAKTGDQSQSSSGGGEGGTSKRLDQLEEQVVDMQVVIGTLESLAKSGAAASPAARVSSGGGGMSSSDAARLDGIETQIRALTAQVESLAEQVRAQGQRRSEALPPPRAGAPAASAAATDFGSTSVSAGDGGGDPIGGLIAGSKTAAASQAGAGYSSAALPPVTSGGAAPAGDGGDQNPKQLYETAYGYLLQQDYGAAETAFDDFLRKYPSDSLSGNAQYWLGESFYVRGQYKQAASAFLKGYQTYGKSAKAPDSLLKLAMSLDKLGQKDAACSSYGELGTRFPTAAPHIKSRATSERQRLGCS
jgi:tol-pal system protein YbgF